MVKGDIGSNKDIENFKRRSKGNVVVLIITYARCCVVDCSYTITLLQLSNIINLCEMLC